MTGQASSITPPATGPDQPQVAAQQLRVGGRVQGVGFRPFIFRLARGLGLCGWVRNRMGEVDIHIQGEPRNLEAFARELLAQAPPLSAPELESSTPVEPAELNDFTIHESVSSGESRVHVPPDLFICDDCLAELKDPSERRYRYPFINCTQCGPRYTLIRGLPYDRPATTMAGFELCDACRTEYENPADRRFHAEPVACPACGPALEFRQHGRTPVKDNEQALRACIELLRDGGIVGLKGIGGYHLVCDAASDAAVACLRRRKQRPHKPLAVMFPAPAGQPLEYLQRAVSLTRDEAALLQSPARPIVLARRKKSASLSSLIAPGLDETGVMLAYSPLHHLLLDVFAAPLVATSANISGEPVLIRNNDAEERLSGVADAFLHHDRPIERPADDAVYRRIHQRPRLLRPGRGCAPLERELPFTLRKPVLAVGGHMKSTIALAWDNRIVVSPHIGDLDNARSLQVFEQTVEDLQSLYDRRAQQVVCDAHPGYTSTRWALRCGLPVHKVFHHHAHAAVACDPRVRAGQWLVFTWDGVGYGEDDSLWGGEALLGCAGNWKRFASLRPFLLPGGDRAAREPWRSAAALCWETGRDAPGLPENTALLHEAWERRLNTPRTSAAGRLFDAAAALTGLCRDASYEGQGPMLLEAACTDTGESVCLPLEQNASGLWTTDWAPLLDVLIDEARTPAARAATFHAAMAGAILQQAHQARREHAIDAIGLCGGVFQNRKLTEHAIELLEGDGFSVYLPTDIPLNDAGLCYGQVIEYAACKL